MKLRFGTKDRTTQVLETDSYNELFEYIRNYLLYDLKIPKHNIFTRIVGISPTKTMIDFGSHSLFFFVNVGTKTLNELYWKENSTEKVYYQSRKKKERLEDNQ